MYTYISINRGIPASVELSLALAYQMLGLWGMQHHIQLITVLYMEIAYTHTDTAVNVHQNIWVWHKEYN